MIYCMAFFLHNLSWKDKQNKTPKLREKMFPVSLFAFIWSLFCASAHITVHHVIFIVLLLLL